MSIETIATDNTALLPFDNELPGLGMPTDYELNRMLFDEPPAIPTRPRLWLSGVVVLEPRESPMQGQLFANWAQSRLVYHKGIGDEPPEEYTGVTYVTKKAIPDTEW